jgi:hypothetical protein
MKETFNHKNRALDIEILKRIARAIIYAVVGGFSGGIGAIVGIAPVIFMAGIYFGVVMGD